MPFFHAKSIGQGSLVAYTPSAQAPSYGCALVAALPDGDDYQLGWTARPVLQQPAADPGDNTNYLSPTGWKPVPVITSGAIDAAGGMLKTGGTFTGPIGISYLFSGTIQARLNGPNNSFFYMDQWGQFLFYDGVSSKSRLAISAEDVHVPSDGSIGFSNGNVFGTVDAKFSRVSSNNVKLWNGTTLGTLQAAKLESDGQLTLKANAGGILASFEYGTNQPLRVDYNNIAIPRNVPLRWVDVDNYAGGGSRVSLLPSTSQANTLALRGSDDSTLGTLQLAGLSNGLNTIALSSGIIVTDLNGSQYSFRSEGGNIFRADAAGIGMTNSINTIALGSSRRLNWSSTAQWYDTADASIGRAGVNTVGVYTTNTGSTLGTLKANKVDLGGDYSIENSVNRIWFKNNPNGNSNGMFLLASGLQIEGDMSYGIAPPGFSANADTLWKRVSANVSKFVGGDGATLGKLQAATLQNPSGSLVLSGYDAFSGQGTTTLTLGAYGYAYYTGLFSAKNLQIQSTTLEWRDGSDVRNKIVSPSDGKLVISDWYDAGVMRLCIGGGTSAFPSLKRNGTAINFRLADDSADAPITASSLTLSNGDSSNIGLDVRPWVKVRSNTGTLSGWLGNGASSFSSVANAETDLALRAINRFAVSTNNSGTPSFLIDTAGNATVSGWFDCASIRVDGSQVFDQLPGAELDVGRQGGFYGIVTPSIIRMGGTTNSHAAIKRNGTAINFRLGDDSADAAITALSSTLGAASANYRGLGWSQLQKATGPSAAPGLLMEHDSGIGAVTYFNGEMLFYNKPTAGDVAAGDLAIKIGSDKSVTIKGRNSSGGVLKITDDATYGIYNISAEGGSASYLTFTNPGSLYYFGSPSTTPFIIGSTGITVTSGKFICLADYINGDLGGSAFLTWQGVQGVSPALQLGANDAASPKPQILQVQSVVAGTSNTAGANFVIKGSAGTGTGVGGSIKFQVAPAGSSGSAKNTFADALVIDSTKAATFSNVVTSSAAAAPYYNGRFQGGAGGGIGLDGGGNLTLLSANASPTMWLNIGGAKVWSPFVFAWGNKSWDGSELFDVTPDLGLARNAAGTLEINNGNAGQYRDLRARAAVLSGNLVIPEGSAGSTTNSIQNAAFREFGLSFHSNNHLSLSRNTTTLWESGQTGPIGYFTLGSTTVLGFSASFAFGTLGTGDVGFARHATNVVEINNGTKVADGGTLGGLQVGGISASSLGLTNSGGSIYLPSLAPIRYGDYVTIADGGTWGLIDVKPQTTGVAGLLRVHNGISSAVNYERLEIGQQHASDAIIRTAAGGTGTRRNLTIDAPTTTFSGTVRLADQVPLIVGQSGFERFSVTYDAGGGVNLASTMPIGWVNGYAGGPTTPTHDAKIVRSATGPTIDMCAAGGLRSRNLANNADAPIAASNVTASGGTVYFGSANGFINRTDGSNTMQFAPSLGSTAMALSAQNLFLYTPTLSFGVDYAAASSYTITGVNRGGNNQTAISVNLKGGNGSSAGSGNAGGNVSVFGGDAVYGNNNGGNVFTHGGVGFGTGTAGNVILAHTGLAARGKVLVGTTTDDGSRLLQVNGTSKLGGVVSVNPYIQLYDNVGTFAGYVGNGNSLHTSITNAGSDLAIRANGKFGISTNNGVTPSFSIDTAGAVVINGSSLTVNGAATFSSALSADSFTFSTGGYSGTFLSHSGNSAYIKAAASIDIKSVSYSDTLTIDCTAGTTPFARIIGYTNNAKAQLGLYTKSGQTVAPLLFGDSSITTLVGLGAAADTLEINNGTLGQYRDLRARDAKTTNAYGTATLTGHTLTTTYSQLAVASTAGGFSLANGGMQIVSSGSFSSFGALQAGAASLISVSVGTSDSTTGMAGTAGLNIYNSGSPGFGMRNSSRAYLQYMSGSRYTWYDSTANLDRMALHSDGAFTIGTMVNDGVSKLQVAGVAAFSGNLVVGEVSSPLCKLTIRDLSAKPSMEFQGASVSDFTGVGLDPNVTTRTTGRLIQSNLTNGGLTIQGISNNANVISPLNFGGYHGATSPTLPAMSFYAFKHNGTTGRAAIASSEIVASFYNSTTAVTSIYGDGSLIAIGAIAQGFGTLVPSARYRLLAAGQRVSEVSDGAGDWKPTIRETHGVASAKLETVVLQYAGDPDNTIIADGFHAVVKNTITGTIAHWVNDGGVMMKSADYSAA